MKPECEKAVCRNSKTAAKKSASGVRIIGKS